MVLEQMMACLLAERKASRGKMMANLEAKLDFCHEELMTIMKAGQEMIRGHGGCLSRKDGGYGFGGKSRRNRV
jgi:hypothetical protein